MPYADPAVKKAYHARKSQEWKERNRKKCSEATAKYRAKHKDKYNAYMRCWRAKNKDKIRATNKAWHAKNSDYLTSPEGKKRVALRAAKSRAKKAGILFSIVASDLSWPETCPVLGIKIDYAVRGHANGNSPSVDRTNPRLGYVPGNVVVMSQRANFLKRDASLEELRKLGAYANGLE